MKYRFWKKALASFVLAAALLSGSEVQAACIKWSNARNVIASNNLLAPGEIRKGAIRRGGEVVSINLCRQGGRYVYRLTVIGRKKRVRDITIDARSGKRVSGARAGRNRRGNVRRKKLEDRIINRVRRNLRRYGIDY